jgi:hypothetical protein
MKPNPHDHSFTRYGIAEIMTPAEKSVDGQAITKRGAPEVMRYSTVTRIDSATPPRYKVSLLGWSGQGTNATIDVGDVFVVCRLHTHVHTHAHEHTHADTHTDTDTDTHSHIRTRDHTGSHAHTPTYTHTHTHTHTHTLTHTHTHTHSLSLSLTRPPPPPPPPPPSLWHGAPAGGPTNRPWVPRVSLCGCDAALGRRIVMLQRVLHIRARRQPRYPRLRNKTQSRTVCFFFLFVCKFQQKTKQVQLPSLSETEDRDRCASIIHADTLGVLACVCARWPTRCVCETQQKRLSLLLQWGH